MKKKKKKRKMEKSKNQKSPKTFGDLKMQIKNLDKKKCKQCIHKCKQS